MTITAETFIAERFELPDGGRWCELVLGEIVQAQPPDIGHGNVVLHLSKALADAAQRRPEQPGATCFDFGLLIGRDPDTLLFPAVAYFAACGPFELSGEEFTERIPELIVEVASTNDRRRALPGKLNAYRGMGVREIWVVDPDARHVLQFVASAEAPRTLSGRQKLSGREFLTDLDVEVESLFAEPGWWKAGATN